MSSTVKSAILVVLRCLALPCALVPTSWRVGLIKGLMVLDSRIGQPGESMKRAFAVADLVDRVIAERATAYGNGEHPKHRLMRYHDFFVSNIPAGSRVIDVGCGYGAVARSIATRVPGVQVLGIDMDSGRLEQARRNANPPNLSFVLGDVLSDIPGGDWNLIVMSNVLEHIEERVDFLRQLVQTIEPERLLIRVPLFERHWHLPMRKELGVGYFSDRTHFIEHTLDEFADEIDRSGLIIRNLDIRWGEIWAIVEPRVMDYKSEEKDIPNS